MKYRGLHQLYESLYTDDDVYISPKQKLGDIYGGSVIEEVNQRIIDYIKDRRVEPVAFDRLFGDKQRLIIPLEQSSQFGEALNAMRSLPNFHEFDPENKRVVFKKPRDPKYGQGDHYFQGKSYGAALKDTNLSDYDKKHFTELFARKDYEDVIKREITNPAKDDNYSVVLSRAPNDIIRMSDWKNMADSCLRDQGCNFHRVAHEALTGGGVAFIVKNEYLDEYRDNPEFYKGEDTFADNKRAIEGVRNPETRIRLIRFLDKQGTDFAVPEFRAYGDRTIPYFYETIVNYLKPRQETEDQVSKMFNDPDAGIVQKGTSYNHKELPELLARYFGTGEHKFPDTYIKIEDQGKRMEHEGIKSLYDDDIDYDDEDNQPDPYEAMERELNAIDRRHDIDHGYVGYDLGEDYDGQEAYYMYNGGITFDIEGYELVDDAADAELNDPYDFRRAADRTDAFGYFIGELADTNFSGRNPTGYSYDYNTDRVFLDFTPQDNISGDTDDYDSFADDIENISENYEEHKNELLNMFYNHGLLENVKDVRGEYDRLKGYKRLENEDYDDDNPLDEHHIEWTNFKSDANIQQLDIYKYGRNVLIKHNPVAGLFDEIEGSDEFGRAFWHFNQTWRSSINDAIHDSMWNMMDANFRPPSQKPTSNNTQGELNLQEMYELMFQEAKFHPLQNEIDFTVSVVFALDTNTDTITYSDFGLKTDSSKDIAFELADYWDAMWKHFEGMLTLIAWECVKQTIDYSSNIPNEKNQYLGYTPPNLVNLERLYGKYVDTSSIGKI